MLIMFLKDSSKSGASRRIPPRSSNVTPTIPALLGPRNGAGNGGPSARGPPPSATVQALEAQVRSPTVGSHLDDDSRIPAHLLHRQPSMNIGDVPRINLRPSVPTFY